MMNMYNITETYLVDMKYEYHFITFNLDMYYRLQNLLLAYTAICLTLLELGERTRSILAGPIKFTTN